MADDIQGTVNQGDEGMHGGDSSSSQKPHYRRSEKPTRRSRSRTSETSSESTRSERVHADRSRSERKSSPTRRTRSAQSDRSESGRSAEDRSNSDNAASSRPKSRPTTRRAQSSRSSSSRSQKSRSQSSGSQESRSQSSRSQSSRSQESTTRSRQQGERSSGARPTARRQTAGTQSGSPQPKRSNNNLVIYGVIAVVVVIVLIFGITTLMPKGESTNSESSSSAQAQSQTPAFEGMPGVEYPDPASLAWRDEDFAVDPNKETEWNTEKSDEKVMYLTFDDGPSENTLKILDILDQYNAKATFFVIGQDPEHFNLIAEAYHRGHTIGLHSMSHEYDQVYKSTDAFFKDLEEIGEVVKEQIGYVPCFTRFPGGSSNTISKKYSEGIMTTLSEEVPARGYQYYDWNLDSGDGASASLETMLQNTNGEADEGDDANNYILLCHDSAAKDTTVEALPQILEHYQALGYEFRAIDRSSWVYHHKVNN